MRQSALAWACRKSVEFVLILCLVTSAGCAQKQSVVEARQMYELAAAAVAQVEADSGEVEFASFDNVEEVRSGKEAGLLPGHMALRSDSILFHSGEGYAVFAGVFRSHITGKEVMTRTYAVRMVKEHGKWQLATNNAWQDVFVFSSPILVDQTTVVIERWFPDQ